MIALQSLMARVAREIGPAIDLQSVLKTVLAAMRSVMAFKGGTICLVEDEHLFIAASDPAVSEEVANLRLPVGRGLAGRCVSSGETVYSPDLDTDPRVDPAIRRLGSNATMKSYLVVPLVCLGEVIGVIQVDSVDADAYDQDDISILEGLATQVAGAIESARRFEHVIDLERQKSDFVARVTHELRTPLTVIAGMTSTLEQRWEQLDDRDRRMLVERIGAANVRLSSMIDELLDISSIEAGGAPVEVSLLTLRPLLEQVVAGSASPESVALRCADDVAGRVDPKVFRHVVGLLVDNALRYAGDATIVVNATDGVTVDVRDRGPGIPPELGERVFDRFVRGDDAKPGMGLGLALARSLAARMDATVHLVPVRRGACFRVALSGRGGSA